MWMQVSCTHDNSAFAGVANREFANAPVLKNKDWTLVWFSALATVSHVGFSDS